MVENWEYFLMQLIHTEKLKVIRFAGVSQSQSAVLVRVEVN